MASFEPLPLGQFLQASRARVTPEQVGLEFFGGRRRVDGLRREEVAMLAGVSTSYYVRLEQGQSRHASPQVLDAVAAALRLDEVERAHLYQLAEAESRRSHPRKLPAEKPTEALLGLLGALGGVPALVLGRRNDVLAWNPMGHALLASHLRFDAPSRAADRPNMTKQLFLDPDAAALYLDRRAKASTMVGNLRLTAAKYPDDLLLAELIGSLCMASPEFAALWSDNRVQPCAMAVYALSHPLVGMLTITQQSLRAVESPDQILVTNTVAPGSTSAEALQLLAQLVGEGLRGTPRLIADENPAQDRARNAGES
jgi:transcriptional regulator with XRE-family HTH domain